MLKNLFISLIGLSAVASAESALTGAGASFPAPVYQQLRRLFFFLIKAVAQRMPGVNSGRYFICLQTEQNTAGLAHELNDLTADFCEP